MPHPQFPPFRPHPLLSNGHVQTVLSAYLPVRVQHPPQRHVLELDDGDRLLLYENRPAEWRDGQRVALLVHGLNGSHTSSYMIRMAEKLLARGVRVFRKELRGFGAGWREARGLCHAGKGEDVAECLNYVIRECPNSPVSLLGFSMGGNIVLKWLGEIGDLAPANLDSALSAAPPIDLMHCAENLRRGFNRLYDWSFVRGLHDLVQRKRRNVPGFKDRRISPLPRRLREFDDLYTAPLIGYSGFREYYAKCSAAHYLPSIRVPTTIVAAADDPVVPVSMFERHYIPSAINLHITAHGGHLGYLAGARYNDPDRFWLDWRVVDWVIAQDSQRAQPADLVEA